MLLSRRFMTLPAIGLFIFAAAPSSAREPEEIAELLRDPAKILLRSAEFDVRQGPPAIPREFTGIGSEPNEARHWIVQVRGPMTESARRHLEANGAEILSYVPNHAYLVRMSPSAARDFAGDDQVSWVGPYRADYKLSPEIGTRTFTDPDRPALPHELLLLLCVFEGESVNDVAEEAARLGADVLGVNTHPRTPRVQVRVDRGRERVLAGIESVEWIEEVGEITLRNNDTRWVAQSNVEDVVPVWSAGLHGEGQVIGHIDGGIDRNSCYFRDPLDNTPGPAHRKIVGYRGSFSADTHGTHTGCTAAGVNVNGDLSNAGLAYNSKVSHTKLNLITGFNNSTSNLYAFLDSASVQGADVHTNSWGDDGFTSYTTWCRDIDAFSRDREEDLVLFAITNLSLLKTPENAKNCLAVGATRQAPSQDLHGSGGSGPTNDGRRKPEVYLPGIGIISAASGSCGTASLSGTSMACPAATGAAALVRQYFEAGFYPNGLADSATAFSPSGALVKATLVNASQDMISVTDYPSNREGWGRILLDDALFFDGDTRTSFVVDVRNNLGLSTGEVDEYDVEVQNGQTLRITMAFTDQPATVGAAFAPINDIDLELEGPDGLFLGNVFAAGSSTTGGTADNRNNVERALLPSGAFTAGTWTIRVRGTSVPSGPQGYAIHVSGLVAPETPPTAVEPTLLTGGAGETRLAQNHPNPFMQSTMVRFSIGKSVNATVSVYDIAGRRIRTLAAGAFDPGEYQVNWDARDERGERVSAGIYFTRLQGTGVDLTRKMVLLK